MIKYYYSNEKLGASKQNDEKVKMIYNSKFMFK